MFTKSESVTGDICIWAIPRSSWAAHDAPPFSYALYANGQSPYQDGSVKVATIPVTLQVPAGINLLQAALDTLEDAKVQARQTYLEKCAQIDKQIEGLQMLTYQPEPAAAEGEFIPKGTVTGRFSQPSPNIPDYVPPFDDDIPF